MQQINFKNSEKSTCYKLYKTSLNICSIPAPESRKPVRDVSPHFPVFKAFAGASYLTRYDLLCQRLVQEQLYTTATLMTSERSAVTTGDFTELSSMTGLRAFITALAGHIAAEAARLG